MYEFGKFRCDPREHLLLREGKPVSLPPKSFEILVILIQSNGRLLTKSELMDLVWPDSFVEEANLAVNISALRKLLGEAPGGQQYIETVPKRGYRFVAPVTKPSDDGAPVPSMQTSGVVPVQPLLDVVPQPKLLEVAAQPKSRAMPIFLWLAAGGLLLVVVVVFAVPVLRRPARLNDKDVVVLADFTNTTGDPIFDNALRQGLSSQLEQSPFLNLLSDDRVAQTLALMAQPKDSRMTPGLAREVCQRTASAAVLDGAITQVGTQYLLTLKATNCSNGESLGSTEAQAADKNHVLDALGKVASEIRSRLGESLASVQKYDAPAENVTTSSLEALKAYSLGYQAMVVRSDYTTAVPLFEQAASLDPNFAMAHARLGTSYVDLNETVLGASSMRKAYELRERVSERERLYIASHYEIFVTGNLEAARKADELLVQTYPHDTSFTNLGLLYSELGDYEKALSEYKEFLRVNPGTGGRYANLVGGYLQLNRPDEAKAVAREALAHNIESPELHLNLYWVDFLEHDSAGMQREAEKLLGKPAYEDQMLSFESDAAVNGGQLVKARILTRRAIESAEKWDEKEPPALYQAEAAVHEALAGNMIFAKQQAQAAIALSDGRDVQALSAIALAMAGESVQAGRMAEDLGKRFPEDTIVQSNYLPVIRASVFLHRGETGNAIEALAAAAPHELGGNLETMSFVFYPVYMRGKAYLAAKQGPAAAAEFQKILAHPGALRSEPIGALTQLELARAFALAGDDVKAKTAYQEFFNLWKDADPDTPVFKRAKTEYSKLY